MERSGATPPEKIGADSVVFELSGRLMVVLASYFPADGAVVEGVESPGELYSLIRRELESVICDVHRLPLHWSVARDTAGTRLPTSPWKFLILKTHQVLSQLLRLEPLPKTDVRTNGYETTSLLQAVYSDPAYTSLASAGGSMRGSVVGVSSSESSTLSSVQDRADNPKVLRSNRVPASADTTPAHIESKAVALATALKKVYVVLKPDLWQNSTTPPVEADDEGWYLYIDEGHLSMAVSALGRFDAYLLAAVTESVLPLINKSDLLQLPQFLVRDERMVVSRAMHARRVYRDSVQTYLITQPKFDWYVALLTSGSIRAVQDTFVDFSQEIWHTQFNRSFQPESAERLESLMVALLGHSHDMVRSQSSVCLNNLIDQHDWQQEVPFLPIIKRTGDPYTITVFVSDAKEDPPRDMFLISMAPSPHIAEYVYTYHSLQWTAVDRAGGGPRAWRGECKLGTFSKCGFYDWRLVRADVPSGSWRVINATLDALQRQCTGSYSLANLSGDNGLEFKSRNLWPELGRLKDAREATGHSHYKTLPIQGRFIVLPNSLRYSNLHEVDVDLCGASFCGAAREERGSFLKVGERLDSLRAHGIDTLCLSGCQARNNGRVSYGQSGELRFEIPDASPYAVTCRAAVCEVLGGRARLEDLVRDATRRGMRVLAEFLSRIAVCGAHRKYNGLTLQCVNESGHRTPLQGGAGRCFEADESIELNYRCKRSWNLYVEDVLEWLDRCDGVRLDCAHLLPRLYEADELELSRLDPDGLPHYTNLEKLVAPVVIPSHRDSGFWSSTAAASHWPNPFLVRVCRAAWLKHPKAILLGDCGLLAEGDEPRIGMLCRSGLVPFVQSLPQVLTRIFGVQLNPDQKQTQSLPPAPPAPCITEWYEKTHESLPEGGILVQASTTAQSPYPTLLYKRGAWPAADLLELSNDVPCTTMGEDEGHCLRRGVANVMPAEDRKTSMPNFLSRSGAPTASVFARAVSLARFEDPKDVDKIESDLIKQFAPETGQDIKQIAAHYRHRREFRRRYPILADATMMPIRAYGRDGEVLDRVFTTCRIDAKNNVVLIGTNFDPDPCPHVEVNISFVGKVISGRHPASGSLVETWNLFAVDSGSFESRVCSWQTLTAEYLHYIRQDQVSLMTLSEFVSFPHVFSVEGYQSSGIGVKVLDKSPVPMPEETLSGLYLCALRRLACLAERAKRSSVTPKLKVAIQANYILQSLTTTSLSETSVSDLAQVLAHVSSAHAWHEELTGDALPKLPELLMAVEYLSAEKQLTTTLFAKVTKIAESLKTAGTGDGSHDRLYELCQELLKLESVSPIVFITSELGKWLTVGGLGVMVDELSSTIANEIGYECVVMSPYYHVNRRGETDYLKADGITWKFNVEVAIGPNEMCVFGVHTGEVNNVRMIFLHNESLFHHPYPDNSAVNAVRLLVGFGKAFLETLCQLRILPQLIVTNDWATGLVPAYAKRGWFADTFAGTTFFHIVHNFDPAYEGRIYPSAGQDFCWLHGLPRDDLIDPLWATPIINPSRCVLLHCDQWGTVSPSYRDELRGTPDTPGSSPLGYLLNNFPQPFAVCNGVPIKKRRDRIAALPFRDHGEAKAELQRKYFNFSQPDLSIPLFSFIGRVTVQKGVHMILDSAESIIQRYNNRVQILVGGPVLWKDPYSAKCGHQMLALRSKYPWSFYAAPNEFFNDGTLVNLGSDFALMPSLFEPGGIVQHEFFVAGTPVLAYNTGGLKDTVHEFSGDEGNGFKFASYNLGDYIYAFERAMRVFCDQPRYLQLRRNAEASVFTCEQSARAWCAEFCRLRKRILLNPKAIAALAQTLPAFDPETAIAAAPALLPQLSLASGTGSSPAAAAAADPAYCVAQFRLYHPRTSRVVAVAGSFDAWSSRRELHWDNALGCFCLDMALPKGRYQFKFVVDGTWICSQYHKLELDDAQIENNIIIVE